MNTAIVEQMRDARTALRAAGEKDTHRRVGDLTGVGHNTIARYWKHSDPDHPAPAVHAEKVEVSATNGATHAPAIPPAEEAFRASWERLLRAGTIALVAQGLPGRQPNKATGDPGTPARFALPHTHPWHREVLGRWHQAYCAHIEAWYAWRGLPTPVEAIATEAATLADLEAQRTALRTEMEQAAAVRNQLRLQHESTGSYRAPVELQEAERRCNDLWGSMIALQQTIDTTTARLAQRKADWQEGRISDE